MAGALKVKQVYVTAVDSRNRRRNKSCTVQGVTPHQLIKWLSSNQERIVEEIATTIDSSRATVAQEKSTGGGTPDARETARRPLTSEPGKPG